jgi:Xaa-Pro aminopeptidase
MAHGPASPKTIERGDAVQVHVAPIARGYAVDLCRTILVEPVPAEMTNALDAYADAQRRAIAAAVPGTPLMGIDATMASALARAGFGEAFLRPVFHGIGIEHEEAPIPGGHAVIHGEEAIDRVTAGMVLGIGNCGIYRETFGVRLEDTVWVSQEGPIVLTSAPNLAGTAAIA